MARSKLLRPRRRQSAPPPPTFRELQKVCRRFQEREDATYRVASLYIKRSWGNTSDVSDGIAVLLLLWNKAFYNRYRPRFRHLTKALEKNVGTLNRLRSRSILSYQPQQDAHDITKVFQSLVEPLSARGKKTPVGIAKALHLLAPSFLPLWDGRIARKYRCGWSRKNPFASCYLRFVGEIQRVCEYIVADYVKTNRVTTRIAVKQIEEHCSFGDFGRSLVKLVDEYNFEKFVRPEFRK